MAHTDEQRGQVIERISDPRDLHWKITVAPNREQSLPHALTRGRSYDLTIFNVTDNVTTMVVQRTGRTARRDACILSGALASHFRFAGDRVTVELCGARIDDIPEEFTPKQIIDMAGSEAAAKATWLHQFGKRWPWGDPTLNPTPEAQP